MVDESNAVAPITWVDAVALLDGNFAFRSLPELGGTLSYRLAPNGKALRISQLQGAICIELPETVVGLEGVTPVQYTKAHRYFVRDAKQLELAIKQFRTTILGPLGNSPPPSTEQHQSTKSEMQRMSSMLPTNTILYGPPGTGKTYSTAAHAVMLCDGNIPVTRDALMTRYEELRKTQRISFVTFHQSYGYEEFVEGLRPHINASGQVTYSVMPGVFRRACDSARVRQLVKAGLVGKPLQERTICKMSLGASWSDEGVKVFQYALENQCILLGYGDDVDFTDSMDESAIRAQLLKQAPDAKKPESHIWPVNFLKNELKVGDIVIVSNGNKSFRGIAEITGDYEFVEDAPFHQMRPVKWLAVFEPGKPVGEIFHKDFSMQTLYKLSPSGLKYERLVALLSTASKEPPVQPHVIIIDEINRANISKVFGELITLLEPDKREGETNAITLKLPYSGEDFTVPVNLHVIGTMNVNGDQNPPESGGKGHRAVWTYASQGVFKGIRTGAT